MASISEAAVEAAALVVRVTPVGIATAGGVGFRAIIALRRGAGFRLDGAVGRSYE